MADKRVVLQRTVLLTERELGQLMCLFAAGAERADDSRGFNLTDAEQVRLAEKMRVAAWECYYERRQKGLPTELDATGVLEPTP